MVRVSKGKKARQEKMTRRDSFSEYMRNHTVLKNLSPMQQSAILTFRLDLIKESERLAEIDGFERGMIVTMAIVLDTLCLHNWKSRPTKKVDELFKRVCDMMNLYLDEKVTFSEMADFVESCTGRKMHTDWMGHDKYPTLEKLFEGKI